MSKEPGKRVSAQELVDIPALISAYYTLRPIISEPTQRVAFGTSGHRGSSLKQSFNETHILAIAQAVCDYRKEAGITGKLFIGKDTHALSTPAQLTALEVFMANGVEAVIADEGAYTPTPVVSFTILEANKTATNQCDGVVITPSHNPPSDGGFKYNPPHGGPADSDITTIIENSANAYIEKELAGVARLPLSEALKGVETRDFITPYVQALDEIIDMKLLQQSSLHVGVDPLGGSGIAVYQKINEIYGLKLEIVNENVDPTFSFMTRDHDGKVRMDCSSVDAMASLIALKDSFDLAFANDPDFDRHGIVTRSVGLMNPNHYLSVAIWYLFTQRKQWNSSLKIGKTLVSSSMIDRVAVSIGREVVEVPVGFKWFVQGLSDGTLGFGGEESAGASFLRKEMGVWSTDKDGIILNLLAFEMYARLEKDPGILYKELETQFGVSFYKRSDAPATPQQKAKLKALNADDVKAEQLAGEKITGKFTHASGNGAAIGGLKVTTENGWFAARPSGTEDIYKIYAESFISQEHLQSILDEAKTLVKGVIA